MANGTQLHYLLCMHIDTQGQTMTRKPLTVAQIRKSKRECGLLYKIIRSRLGLSQTAMGRLIGCSLYAIINREAKKRIYTVGEMVTLYEVSGMTPDEWVALMKEIAK